MCLGHVFPFFTPTMETLPSFARGSFEILSFSKMLFHCLFTKLSVIGTLSFSVVIFSEHKVLRLSFLISKLGVKNKNNRYVNSCIQSAFSKFIFENTLRHINCLMEQCYSIAFCNTIKNHAWKRISFYKKYWSVLWKFTSFFLKVGNFVGINGLRH